MNIVKPRAKSAWDRITAPSIAYLGSDPQLGEVRGAVTPGRWSAGGWEADRGVLMAEPYAQASVNHVVRICTYTVRIQKVGDVFNQKYVEIRTFAQCLYPVRIYIFALIASICEYLQIF